MRKMKVRLPVLLIVISLLITFFVSIDAFAEPGNEEIQIDVKGGFNGISKLGAWAPIHVTVSSVNRDISGEIQVEANLDQARRIILAKPVELTVGGEQDIFFEIPVISAKKEINIRLVEKKKTIAEKTYKFNRLLPPETMLIGVLSEDAEAFTWMNGNTIPVMQGYYEDEKMKLMIASGQISAATSIAVPYSDKSDYQKREAVVVPLGRDSFPERTDVMDGFDFLVISKYDTALLNDSQVDTLERWVDTGGVLILGTGLNWQKVYHGLPDSLKPFSIKGIKDYDGTKAFRDFTGRETPDMTLKLTYGSLGFEYLSLSNQSVAEFKPGNPARYIENDIIAGDAENPLVIKYRKEMGHILVFTFDPVSEPFVSWQAKVTFADYALRYITGSIQRFYEYGNGVYQKQYYSQNNFQYLANEVPDDKKPPFFWMFVGLAIYIILAGPVLYLLLKKFDRRDWAWVLIPLLSVVFLTGMYLFGFKSRYHTAVMNTVSLIQVSPDSNEAAVSSAIGVFNDKRGTLKLEYTENNGLQTPMLQNNDMYYKYSQNEAEGKVVAKLTLGDRAKFEQYDVMLWTPTILNAQRTIPFDGTILKGIYLKDGKLQGSITNPTPYHLLDTVIVFGNNIVPIGDVLSGDTKELNIPLDSTGNKIYKRPDEYLDGEFGRSYYNNVRDYPSNFYEMQRKRRIFENYIHQLQNTQQGKARFALLARNEQEMDYGMVINDKEPQKYNHSLIVMQSDFVFQPGQEVEIPGGIIWPGYFQDKEVGWQEGMNGIRIRNLGDLEFQFVLPDNLDVNEMQLFIESYIPLYTKYNMMDNQNNGMQTQILTNRYEYYLYNAKTHEWDTIDANTTISEDAPRYIGVGREVRMKVSVVELGQANREEENQRGIYIDYQMELLSMPEIRVKGVAR